METDFFGINQRVTQMETEQNGTEMNRAFIINKNLIVLKEGFDNFKNNSNLHIQ